MGAILLDGEPVAARIRAEVADRVAELQARASPSASARSSWATTCRASATSR